jgi:hypothetical protein
MPDRRRAAPPASKEKNPAAKWTFWITAES